MLMREMLSKRSVRIAALLVCGFCAVQVIRAFNPQPDPPGFGLIGFTPASEYARLNVSNVGIPGLPIGGSCQVQLTFGDGQGGTLKRSEVITLALGKSTSLDLLLSDFPVTTLVDVSPRHEVLPAVQRGGSCFLASSVEIVNATGQTTAYAPYATLTGNHNETLVRDSESQ
jgi:hypothetical protein